MAAVAVAGVASAQVTITGGIAYGWQSSTESVTAVDGAVLSADGTTVTAGTAGAGETQLRSAVTGGDRVERAGFGVDTASVTFAANEDLGGGMSVSGSMTIGGINRCNAFQTQRINTVKDAKPLATKKPHRVATAGFLIF